MQRLAFSTGIVVLGVAILLSLKGLLFGPVEAKRTALEQRLAEVSAPELDFNAAADPEFDAWQRAIASQPALWQPLIKPQAQAAAPPNLTEMLAGVEPTRNEIGSGEDLKVLIRVDAGKDWFTKGQPIKGCTIKEITAATVVFSVIQNGQEYAVAIPRQ